MNGVGLSDTEKQLLERIPEIGFKLLSKIPRLEPAAQIVLFQNKGFDGSGFPKERSGGPQIPIGARLLRILADLSDLEAKGLPKAKALEQLRRTAACYDPRILEVVSRSMTEAPAPSEGKPVKVKDLIPGCQLVTPIETTDGMPIAPAGTTLTDTMLERIQNFAELMGIREPIYVKFAAK